MAKKQKQPKTYEWEGETVSRSSYFRKLREQKKALASITKSRDDLVKAPRVAAGVSPGDQKRARIAAVPRAERGDYVHVRDAVIERERIEAFMLLTDNPGIEDLGVVHFKVPRKILRAVHSALTAAGY